MGGNQSVVNKTYSKKSFSNIGMLQIQLINLYINQKNPLFKGEDIQLKLSISHQQFYCTQKQLKSHKRNNQTTIFNCFINSLYKRYGRMLIVNLWSNETLQKFSSQTRAISILDLNPFVEGKNQSQTTRCHLNFQKHNIGYIDIKIKFKKLQYYTFDFYLNKLLVENNQTIQGNPYCRLYAGQQVLQTHLPRNNNNQQKLRQLKNNRLQFCIPKELKQISIQVLQKIQNQFILIGQASINLDHIDQFQLNKPFKIDLYQNQKYLGYVQIQIQQVRSGKSLKQIISEGAYSMKQIRNKSDKDIVTQPSTNFFRTQRRIGTMNSLQYNEIKIKTASQIKANQDNSNDNDLKQTSIKIIEEPNQNTFMHTPDKNKSRNQQNAYSGYSNTSPMTSKALIKEQEQNQIQPKYQKRGALPPINNIKTQPLSDTNDENKQSNNEKTEQRQCHFFNKNMFKDMKIPCLTIGNE